MYISVKKRRSWAPLFTLLLQLSPLPLLRKTQNTVTDVENTWVGHRAIGFDQLPESIKNSKILTGNHLGQLANVHEKPVINPAFEDKRLKNIFQYFSTDPAEMEKELHLYASELLDEGKVAEAWQVLLALAWQ